MIDFFHQLARRFTNHHFEWMTLKIIINITSHCNIWGSNKKLQKICIRSLMLYYFSASSQDIKISRNKRSSVTELSHNDTGLPPPSLAWLTFILVWLSFYKFVFNLCPYLCLAGKKRSHINFGSGSWHDWIHYFLHWLLVESRWVCSSYFQFSF